MKKKFLFGLGSLAIAAALTFNVSIAISSNGSGVDLNTMNCTSTAQALVNDLGPCSWSVKLCTGGCCLNCFEGGTTCIAGSCAKNP